MAKIVEFREIPLGHLEIGKGQSRVRQLMESITELADSIKKLGQVAPILVCPGTQEGKYEILIGQRRYLAHVELGLPTIQAAVLDSRVDEAEAKAISLTENVMRRDLNRLDKIDGCTYLFKKYGSALAVAEATGLPYHEVRDYVKYDRLESGLREMVDRREVELKTALRAQNAAEQMGGDVGATAAVIAREMSGMSGAAQRKLERDLERSSGRPIEDVIEEVKIGAQVTQIIVTLGPELHSRLRRFADDEGTTQDDAAASLIDEGLASKGYLD